MQSLSIPTDPLASIEHHLLSIEQRLDQQSIALAALRDELADANRRAEWYHVQFSEMLRVLARDLHELRATLICSVVSEGPISAQVIQSLLRESPGDDREVELSAQPRAGNRGN
ncbi:MAG TPA: hypothetical protein PLO33_06470 [Kouleothrix sp.]|uniref:hypothetical protein n=1 Tax=Kouleothrix sp. TaxID=2779161 RepID=UPI002D1B9860|nr:hypothetical protein [Kouleothrix sp.]HRC75305.1 hypothetical protein [Kouleothrix sp.]